MMFKNVLIRMKLKLIAGFLGVVMLFPVVSCSSGPEQSPEDFIKTFIEKHISMLDLSTADYYVKDEQSRIRELITRTIQSKKEEGVFESLKKAKYDVSNIRVKMLNQKEEYVNDKQANFAEIETKGFYTITMDEKEQTIIQDEVFVLQAVGKEWKITEKTNPWK